MRRWLVVGMVLGLTGCAGNSLQVPDGPRDRVEPKAVPGAVTLTFTGGSPELTTAAAQLLPHAKRRLEALGHAVVPQSELAVELDLRASQGANSVQMCVQVVGRVVRGGQRFTAVELCRVACTTATMKVLGGPLGALFTNVGLLFLDENERAAGPAAEAVDALLTDLSRYARVRASP